MRLARGAGLLYLVVAILGGLAQIVRVKVYAPGDAAATSANLVANATLVRLSFVADLIQAMVWLVLAVTLYRLLAHAGRTYGATDMPVGRVWRSSPALASAGR